MWAASLIVGLISTRLTASPPTARRISRLSAQNMPVNDVYREFRTIVRHWDAFCPASAPCFASCQSNPVPKPPKRHQTHTEVAQAKLGVLTTKHPYLYLNSSHTPPVAVGFGWVRGGRWRRANFFAIRVILFANPLDTCTCARYNKVEG